MITLNHDAQEIEIKDTFFVQAEAPVLSQIGKPKDGGIRLTMINIRVVYGIFRPANRFEKLLMRLRLLPKSTFIIVEKQR